MGHFALYGFWVALLVAGLVRLLGRRQPALAQAAGGLGVLAAIATVLRWPHGLAFWLHPPLASGWRLAGPVLLALLAAALLAGRAAPAGKARGKSRKAAPPARGMPHWLPILALASGWWLAGGPVRLAEWRHGGLWALALLAGSAAAIWLAPQRPAPQSGWPMLAAALAMAGGLGLIDALMPWRLLALGCAGAALALSPRPASSPEGLLPVALGLVGTAALALRHGGRAELFIAALAPLALPWLAPRLLPGRPILGPLLALFAVLVAVFVASRV